MRTLVVAGTKMADWAGVEVWKFTKGAWQIDQNWRWSLRSHQHYEVARIGGGSYWVPTSTNPPKTWKPVERLPRDLNKDGNVVRPARVYIWIPEDSIPETIHPGQTPYSVDAHPPATHPPA
jgi:hypothetical protein